MYTDLKTFDEFTAAANDNLAVLVYFSHEKCNVCKVLKPKVEELILEKYPNIKLFYADTVDYPEIAAQNQVFTVPTILIYFDGRETFRKSRNIGIGELDNLLSRPYELIYS